MFKSSAAMKTSPAPLLPLVDVLFSMLGIIMVVLAFNTVSSGRIQPSRPQADMAVVCRPDLTYAWYTKTRPAGLVMTASELHESLTALMQNRGQRLVVIVGFSGEAFDGKKELARLLESLKLDPSERKSEPPVDLVTLWWPLSGADDLPPSVRDWQKLTGE